MLGYEPAPPSRDPQLSTAERRKALKLHDDLWGNLDWVESRFSMPISEKSEGPDHEQLSGRTYAVAKEAGRSIYVIELPPPGSDDLPSKWEHKDVGCEILVFCINVERNLLLIVEQPSEE